MRPRTIAVGLWPVVCCCLDLFMVITTWLCTRDRLSDAQKKTATLAGSGTFLAQILFFPRDSGSWCEAART
jgi:hypothetical protein